MNKPFPQSVRRPVSWALGLCFAILVFALAACGDSGSSNAAPTATATPAPAASVNIKETKGANSTSDVYLCDPASITIHKGDQVSFTNQSDEIQDFDQGDAQKAGVDFKMDLNQSVTVTFNTTGTFVIKSEKGATITVTVQ